MSGHDFTSARRYLLGEGGDEERAIFEQEYLADANALERLETAEEHLIEDYLAERLDTAERSRFERFYLSFAHRRRRVETIRALIAAAEHEPVISSASHGAIWWASWSTAALVILVLGGWWTLRTTPQIPAEDPRAAARPPSTPTAPNGPRIFSLSISPITVRSAGDRSTLVIPAGTDIVRLQLEGDGSRTRVDRARVRVRTVTGTEVWSGPAAPSNDAPAGTVAQIEMPAARMPADDYVIELLGADPNGAERERARYFLSVRAR